MHRNGALDSCPNTGLQSQEKSSTAIFLSKWQRQVWDFTGEGSNQVTKTTLNLVCQEKDRESERKKRHVWLWSRAVVPPGREVTGDWRWRSPYMRFITSLRSRLWFCMQLFRSKPVCVGLHVRLMALPWGAWWFVSAATGPAKNKNKWAASHL